MKGETSPPGSPAHSMSSASLFPAKLGLDSPASLASVAAAGLSAPGSYPHPASGPGPAGLSQTQPQTNGGPAPGLSQQNNLQDHLQQQKVSTHNNFFLHLYKFYLQILLIV